MRKSAWRYFVCTALLLLTSGALAEIHLTPAVDVNPEAALGPEFGLPAEITAARVRGGFIAAWPDDRAIHVALLDREGTRKRVTRFEVPGMDDFSPIMSASDGVDALVVVRTYVGRTPGAVLCRVGADGSVTELSRPAFPLYRLIWNGISYIATTNDRVVEIDRDGIVLAETPLPQRSHLHVSVYAVGPRVWAVTQLDSTVARAALTNDAGHLIPAQWVDLPFEIPPYHYLATAGADGSGMFLVLRISYGDSFVKFLDREGVAVGEPIVLNGFGDDYNLITGRDNTGALLVLAPLSGNLARVTRGRSAHPREDLPRRGDGDDVIAPPDPADAVETASAVTSTSTTLTGFVRSQIGTLLPAAGGALFIGMTDTRYDGGRGATPVAAVLHTTQNALAVSRNEGLAYAATDMRNAAAAAHGDGFLVAWQQAGLAGSEIWIRQVDTLGDPKGTARFLGAGESPQVASRGDLAMVVWERRSAPTIVLEGMAIGPDDAPIAAAPMTVATVPFGPRVLRKVVFDATQFNVFFSLDSGFHSAVVPVEGGRLSPPLSVSAIPRPFHPDAIGVAPGRTLLVSSGGVIEAATLRHDLSSHTAPHTIFVLGGIVSAPVWTGEHFVLTWWHNGDHFRFGRVSSAGQPLDSEFGQVLGNLAFPAVNGLFDFSMVLRGDQYVIATRGQLAILRSGSSTEGVRFAGDAEALVAHPGGTILLVTSVSDPANHFHPSRIHVRALLP
jgi:hypothetical protein